MRLLESLGRCLWRGLAAGLVLLVLAVTVGLTVVQWVWDHVIFPALPWLTLILACGLLTFWLACRFHSMRRRRHALELEHQRLAETVAGVPHDVSTWTWQPR